MRKNKNLKKFFCIFLCTAVVVVTSVHTNSNAATPATNEKFATESNSAYAWLEYQQDQAVVTSTGLASGIVDSFEDYAAVNQPYTDAYTYDQAVAAIAFLIKGDTVRAKKVLSAMENIQASDGSWVNSYYYNTLGGGELRKHVGPIMWVALAVMNYEIITGDTTTYRQMALDAIDWCLQFRQPNGALSGGMTTWDVAGSWTNEVWSSTEQNEDAYAALTYFAGAATDKAAVYQEAAEGIKNFLDNVVWDSTNNRFMGGYKNDTQAIDPFIPMDANPWGVLSLGLSGTHDYAASLDYIENASGDSSGTGTLAYPKYKHTLTDESTGSQITAYDFDWESDGAAASSSIGGGYLSADIWFEGSAFMACAYYLNGESGKADSILTEIAKKQATNDTYCNGGIPYSLYGTNNNYWKMSQQNCVSSTGWFIIAAAKWNPFTGTSLIEGSVTPVPTTTVTPTATPAPAVSPTPAPSAYTIGEFSAKLSYGGTTLTVTLTPAVSTAATYNIWYTCTPNPTLLSQATAGYAIGSKDSDGNYVVTIPDVTIGSNGVIYLFLATNTGDTGWVEMNVY